VKEIPAGLIKAAVNQGVSLINYLGYGSYDTWETGGINNNELLKLENTTQFPNIFSSACWTDICRRAVWQEMDDVSYRSRNQACGARPH
jgi:hypothetical protein